MTPIIICDPSEQTRMLLGVSFKAWGFEAITAENERAAAALAMKHEAFVLTDCDRSARTTKLMQIIEEKAPMTRVIGYVSPEFSPSIRTFARMGMLSFLLKPLEVRELHYSFIKTIKTSLAVGSREREGDFSVREHRELSFPPDPSRIPLVVRQLTGLINRMPNGHSARYLLYGLIENAVLYGSLKLTKERVIAAYESDTLGPLMERAVDIATDKGRNVRITYDVVPANITITISDPGTGFDWRSSFDALAAGDCTGRTGRTVLLSKIYFDEMRYNDAGNEVTVTIRLGTNSKH